MKAFNQRKACLVEILRVVVFHLPHYLPYKAHYNTITTGFQGLKDPVFLPRRQILRISVCYKIPLSTRNDSVFDLMAKMAVRLYDGDDGTNTLSILRRPYKRSE